jgi:hypothetical protein
MNRRKFCASSVAAAISVTTAGSGRLCAAPAPSVLPGTSAPGVELYKFVYDRRYSATRAFGVAAEQGYSTAGTAAIDGDVTALWSRDLRARWLADSGAIAGMTTARTLLCLEQLAKDHWMRVVVRADHAISKGHEIAHRLFAPEAMAARMSAALAAADWPAQLPAALACCQSKEGAPRLSTLITAAGGRRWAATQPTLVSFVIA